MNNYNELDAVYAVSVAVLDADGLEISDNSYMNSENIFSTEEEAMERVKFLTEQLTEQPNFLSISEIKSLGNGNHAEIRIDTTRRGIFGLPVSTTIYRETYYLEKQNS